MRISTKRLDFNSQQYFIAKRNDVLNQWLMTF